MDPNFTANTNRGSNRQRATARRKNLELGMPYGETPGEVEGIAGAPGTPTLPKVQKNNQEAQNVQNYADTGDMGGALTSATGKKATFEAGSRGSR